MSYFLTGFISLQSTSATWHVIYWFALFYISWQSRLQMGWVFFFIIVYPWYINKFIEWMDEWMKLALKFRKLISKEGSWNRYLMGENFQFSPYILSHFQYYLFFAFSFFSWLFLPEVYLFIRLLKEPVFGLVEPFISCLSSCSALYLFTLVCICLFYLCTLKIECWDHSQPQLWWGLLTRLDLQTSMSGSLWFRSLLLLPSQFCISHWSGKEQHSDFKK